jgi:hypothetical protein
LVYPKSKDNIFLYRGFFSCFFIKNLNSSGDEIKHYSLGQLTVFHELLQKSTGDSCLLLAGDQVQLQVCHFKKMRAAFEAKPLGEIFTSYAEWRGGTPILLSKSLLEKVTGKSFHTRGNFTSRKKGAYQIVGSRNPGCQKKRAKIPVSTNILIR